METSRLFIRSAKLADVNDIFEMRSSEFVLKYNMLGDVSYENTVKVVEKHQQSDNVFYLVLKDSNKVIGEVTLENDSLRYGVKSLAVSYYLHEKYTKQGFMSEALIKMMDFVFNGLDMEVLAARVFTGNQDSSKLLKKLGFKLEGYLRHCVKGYQDVIHDDYLFSILKSEYKELYKK